MTAFLGPCPSGACGASARRGRNGCTRWASAPSASWRRRPRNCCSTTSVRLVVTWRTWCTGATIGWSRRTGRRSRSAPRRHSPRTSATCAALRTWLLDLVDQLGSRLRKAGLRTRTVELKVRSSDFRTRTALAVTAGGDGCHGCPLARRPGIVRSLGDRTCHAATAAGRGASGLTRDGTIQGDLFADGERLRQGALDKAIDAIRLRLGPGAIRRGSLLDPTRQEGDHGAVE